MHGANGYLVQEFLSPVSNIRDDQYGGSPENRARFAIEVTRSVAEAVGADRTGIRLSPQHNIQGVLEEDDDDALATYLTVAEGLAPLGLAFVDILNAAPTSELVQRIPPHSRSAPHHQLRLRFSHDPRRGRDARLRGMGGCRGRRPTRDREPRPRPSAGVTMPS